jgi:hypothetical protein
MCALIHSEGREALEMSSDIVSSLKGHASRAGLAWERECDNGTS